MRRDRRTLLTVASIMALVALALMMWGFVDPRSVPIIVFMSVGQGLGTLSFAIYLFAIWSDLRRAARHLDEGPPEP